MNSKPDVDSEPDMDSEPDVDWGVCLSRESLAEVLVGVEGSLRLMLDMM